MYLVRSLNSFCSVSPAATTKCVSSISASICSFTRRNSINFFCRTLLTDAGTPNGRWTPSRALISLSTPLPSLLTSTSKPGNAVSKSLPCCASSSNNEPTSRSIELSLLDLNTLSLWFNPFKATSNASRCCSRFNKASSIPPNSLYFFFQNNTFFSDNPRNASISRSHKSNKCVYSATLRSNCLLPLSPDFNLVTGIPPALILRNCILP